MVKGLQVLLLPFLFVFTISCSSTQASKDNTIRKDIYEQCLKYAKSEIYNYQNGIKTSTTTLREFNSFYKKYKSNLSKKEDNLMDAIVDLMDSTLKENAVNGNYKEEYNSAIKILKDIYGDKLNDGINQEDKKIIVKFEKQLNKIVEPYAEKWTTTAYEIRNLFETNGNDDPSIRTTTEELNKQTLNMLVNISKMDIPDRLSKDVKESLNSSRSLLKNAILKSDQYMSDYRGFWNLRTSVEELNNDLLDAIEAQKEFKNSLNEINKKYNIEPIKYFTFSIDDMHLKQEPAIGMTEDEVKNSTWGEPEHVNTTITEDGVSEQWVYSGYRYIYFDNGVVTAIQK